MHHITDEVGWKFPGEIFFVAGNKQVAGAVCKMVGVRHTINLFTWPAGSDVANDVRALAKHGFNLRHWQRGGMAYWAVSDLNDEELGEFVKLYQERVGEAK